MTSSTVVPIGLKTRMDDRMKVALNAMPVAISWNRIDDGVVEFMNQRFTALTGYTLAEAGTVADLITKTFAERPQADLLSLQSRACAHRFCWSRSNFHRKRCLLPQRREGLFRRASAA